MSDARAKAEARRAKILARSTNNTVSAVIANEDEEMDETLYNNLANTEVKVKVRPLARRRQLVSSTSSGNIEDQQEEPSTPTKPSTTTENKTDKEEKKESSATTESVSPTSPITTTATSATESTESKPKIKYAPAKSMEEIEREIAEQTASFDNAVRSDGKSKKGSNKDKDSDTKKQEVATTKSAVLKVKPIAIDPSNVLRLLRVLMIVALGCFTGFQTVSTQRQQAIMSMSMPMKTGISSSVVNSVVDSVDSEFTFEPKTDSIESTTTLHSTATIDNINDDNSNRTWSEYFQQRLTRQIECSVTAVGLVYWLSRFLSPVVHSQFKQEVKSKKPLEMVMDLLTNGVSSIFESVYGFLGEVTLHLFVLIVSVAVFTAFFANNNYNNINMNESVATEL